MARFGISVALLTPFRADGALDTVMLGDHARNMMDAGVDGVTLFGTTGEGASVGLAERRLGIDALIAKGIDPARIVLGVYGTAVEDVAAQVEQGRASDITQFLLPPPFYFGDVSDDGLFNWFSEMFGATDAQTRFILYHIPQVTRVPLSIDLVHRIVAKFADRVAAIKDSSGVWDNAKTLLEHNKLPVLTGDERLLHRAVAMGGAGSICGMANLYPKRMLRIFETGQEDPALSAEVNYVVSHPVMATLKALMAKATNNPEWERLRAPMTPLASATHMTAKAHDLLPDADG
jgi:4-hydroxy-tetrahydrodipicolinate synthase